VRMASDSGAASEQGWLRDSRTYSPHEAAGGALRVIRPPSSLVGGGYLYLGQCRGVQWALVGDGVCSVAVHVTSRSHICVMDDAPMTCRAMEIWSSECTNHRQVQVTGATCNS